MNIMMAEGDRRLRCCHPDLEWKKKAWFLTDFSIQMMDCGHSAKFRDVVVSRVVARYQESLRKHQGGERPIYRTREEREEACKEAGGRPGRSDWFRKCGASTVISVPATEGSKLASKVREALAAAPDPTGCKTLVVEQPGPSVRQGLVRSDPLPRGSCGRPLCPWAKTEEECRMRCFREGVGYVGRCRRCYLSQVKEGGEGGAGCGAGDIPG